MKSFSLPKSDRMKREFSSMTTDNVQAVTVSWTRSSNSRKQRGRGKRTLSEKRNNEPLRTSRTSATASKLPGLLSHSTVHETTSG